MLPEPAAHEPSQELLGQILRDPVAFDETGQQTLTEERHAPVTVPCLERVKGTVVRERSVGHEDVPDNPSPPGSGGRERIHRVYLQTSSVATTV